MRRRIILLLGVLALAVVLTGCGGDDSARARTLAQQEAETFGSGDMAAINELLFPAYRLQAPEALEGELEGLLPAGDTGDGALSALFALAAVEVKDVGDGEITYVIKAPDLTGFFTDRYEELSAAAPAEAAALLLDYAGQAAMRESTVTLGCMWQDGVLSVNYRDEAFLDAMTGGLVTAYGRLYQEALEEYREALGQ